MGGWVVWVEEKAGFMYAMWVGGWVGGTYRSFARAWMVLASAWGVIEGTRGGRWERRACCCGWVGGWVGG